MPSPSKPEISRRTSGTGSAKLGLGAAGSRFVVRIGDDEHDPLQDAEIEIVCPRCGYRMTRTAARLRRRTKVVCPQCGEEIAGTPEEGSFG